MKSIKLIMVLVLLLLGGSRTMAALDFPAVPTFKPGASNTLTVGATTPEGASAMQFTLILPDGFTLASTSITLDKSRATDHTYRLNRISDSTYKCVIYSNANTPFSSTSGKLFSLRLKAASSAARGEYAVKFTDITVADASGEETGLADASVNLTVVILATSVRIVPSSLDVTIGKETRLTAEVSPSGADQTVEWKLYDSASAEIISIGSDGVVKGLALGTARVVAATTDGSGRSAVCTVNVIASQTESITLDRTELPMRVRDTDTLTASVAPDGASRQLVWSSSNPGVAEVDDSGHVTANAIGEATVTAASTDGSGVRAECRVTVAAALVHSVTLSKTDLSLRLGEEETLTATAGPDYAGNRMVAWSSSDTSVATVDQTGRVAAIGLGSASVTATSTDGSGISASCRVTVTPPMASGIILNFTELTLRVQSAADLTATVTPALAQQSVTWTSDAPEVASVDPQGTVLALSQGTAVITAATNDGSGISASCRVDVIAPLAQSITLDCSELMLEVLESAKITSTVAPAEADQTVNWNSSDLSVVSVDESGNVTAIDTGMAVITATTSDGTGLTAACVVKVNGSSGIEHASIEEGNVTVRAEGSDIIVSGASSDDEIKILDASGFMIYAGYGHHIRGLSSGLHIVIVNTKAYKVMLP